MINFGVFNGVIPKKFVSSGQTVNVAFYRNKLAFKNVCVTPALYRSEEWFALHVDSSAHSSMIVSKH